MTDQENIEERVKRLEHAVAALERATTKEVIAEAVRLQLSEELAAEGEADYSYS